MKVKLIRTGKIVVAKRFKNLTKLQVKNSTDNPDWWNPESILVKPLKGCKGWRYMLDYQVEVIEE